MQITIAELREYAAAAGHFADTEVGDFIEYVEHQVSKREAQEQQADKVETK